MAVIGLFVFVALYYVRAGYGVFYSAKWGPSFPNRWGWVLMESPVFVAMTLLWLFSERTWQAVPLVFFLFFQTHYFIRSFVFPCLIRGKGRMPIAIVAMGALFNTMNAFMQGGWIFYFSPAYPTSWFLTPQFIVGTLLFFFGMAVNQHSDAIIRGLRQPGDTRHYIPQGGMFRYVSSANYFGELVEWIGFAVLTWSLSGAVFAWWTFANLAPRADAIRRRYETEFGDEFRSLHRKRIIPFIY